MKAEIQIFLKRSFPVSFEEVRNLVEAHQVQKVVLKQKPIPPPHTENHSKSQDKMENTKCEIAN